MIAPAFHAHLDVCRQCEEQPFNLCPVGEQLLRAAVGEHVAGKFGAGFAEPARELALAAYDLAVAAEQSTRLPAHAQPDGDPGYNDEPWERT